jgi:hypothetical protein
MVRSNPLPTVIITDHSPTKGIVKHTSIQTVDLSKANLKLACELASCSLSVLKMALHRFPPCGAKTQAEAINDYIGERFDQLSERVEAIENELGAIKATLQSLGSERAASKRTVPSVPQTATRAMPLAISNFCRHDYSETPVST